MTHETETQHTETGAAAPRVAVPADLLETLLLTAEQALWYREWAARDAGRPVPGNVARRLAVVAQVRALLPR